MRIATRIEEHQATIETVGYLNRHNVSSVSLLALSLSRQGVRILRLDFSESPLICVGALEELMQAKSCVAALGTTLEFQGLTATQAKVLQLMGLDGRGEIPA